MGNTSEVFPPDAISTSPDGRAADNIKQYIDASAGSADRARFVLLVMVTASVLALLAMWNSRQGNMTIMRLAVATHAQKFYDPADAAGRTILPDDKVRPLFTTQEEFDSTKHFMKQARTRFANLDHLKKYVESLERTRTERIINVSVPFFGIVFDINDLGMLAGISFFITLLLFRFSLFRELRNVRLVFKQASTVEQLELCYNRLAMQQVLTSPPPLDLMLAGENEWEGALRLRGLFWDHVSKLLYVLPLVAHAFIFWNDWNTISHVKDVYPGIEGSLWVSGVFLALNALLTLVCLSLGLKIDKTWRNHARFILEKRAAAPDDLSGDDDAGAGRRLAEARERGHAAEGVKPETQSRG